MVIVKSNINGITYYLKVDQALAPYAQVLFNALKGIPANKMREGYRFEIGFSVFTCRYEGDGYQILAPDYSGSPFRDTTEDLTISLWVLLEQAQLLKKYGLSGSPTRFDDEVVVAENALESRIVCLQRYSDLGENTSGWCIEAVRENEDGSIEMVEAERYETMYAYQIMVKRSSLIKILAFPYDYVVVFDGEEISEILNSNNESILE